jgi:hypothetical protein
MAMNFEIIISIAIGLIAGVAIYFTWKYPSKVREWMLYAVTEAERELGGGTGQLKLRKVYDMFLAKFPKLSIFISFDTFSRWVDIALDKMREMIEKNPAAKKVITE